MENADLPAMPIVDNSVSTRDAEIYPGLTKREMLAMNAMQGLLANSYGDSWSAEQGPVVLARQSVEMADALLKELDK